MMDTLLQLFPQHQFSLLAVILGMPLLGALINGVFGKRLGKEGVTPVALFAVGVPFLASLLAFGMLLALPKSEGQSVADAPRFVWDVWHWMNIATPKSDISVNVAFSMDALNAIMALVVTGVGFLIHLYSTKYMQEDASYTRFFTYLNLFIFSMLVLILGDSLPILFVGWEGVGLCSYLLIGFWFTEDANASAGKKAFIANRIGDFGLLVAMAMLAYYGGALDWSGLNEAAPRLAQEVQLWPLGSLGPGVKPITAHASTLIALSLFLGCAGKSAQIPLYVWLPDAMAGPTPVSALIHAATMVTAGVYLMCRMATVFLMAPAAMVLITFIGALTALLAATIAVTQTDIKKVLAYSTVSQLGFMFMATGAGAFTMGFFHVVTHAFFKACLFLGAGSVIHAMHARIHDNVASQDMRNMGGMRKFLPLTRWTFLFACLAIAGLPLTSGFFSKEGILFHVWHTEGIAGVRGNTVDLFDWPTWWGDLIFAMGLTAAVMTAFYMFRLYFGIFSGTFRGWNIVSAWKDPHGGHHDEHHDEHHDGHAHGAHHAGARLDGPTPHESPWQMTVPLLVLGVLALVGGVVQAHIPWTHLGTHWFEEFLFPVLPGHEWFLTAHGTELLDAGATEGLVAVLGIGAFVVGVGAAYYVYIVKRGEPARVAARQLAPLYRVVRDKWRVDEVYDATILGAVDVLATVSAWADKWIVDGIIAKLPVAVVSGVGSALRRAQTGRVQAYAAVMVAGLAGLAWYLVSPGARAEVTSHAELGVYEIRADQGLGLTYRWDVNGDGEFDATEFGDERLVRVQLAPGEHRVVLLEVKDAFGGTSVDEFELEQAAPVGGGEGAGQ